MVPRTQPDIPYIAPGFAFMALEPAWLWGVVGSGVIVTIYDRKRKLGGMAHYCLPTQAPNQPTTTYFAVPAILSLLKMFLNAGSQKEDLEAQIYGGAENPDHVRHQPGVAQENVRVGMEFLKTRNIHVAGIDVGGRFGRKVGFQTETGETALAKVSSVRYEDWYPRLPDPTNDSEGESFRDSVRGSMGGDSIYDSEEPYPIN